MINNLDLLWLCGFIDMESQDKYKKTEEERKKLKSILKQLREMKK